MQTTQNQILTVGPMPSFTRTTSKKMWVKRKYLCKAASRLTQENARQIKARHAAECKGDEINVNSFTRDQRAKYGIPENELLATLIEGYKAQEEAEKQERYICSDLIADIDAAYHSLSIAIGDFHKHYNFISDKYTVNKETCRKFAQRWSAWEFILTNYDKYKLTAWYNAYIRHFPQHVSDKFSFSNFKKACEVKGIESKVIDQRAITKKTKRISPAQEAFLTKLYIQPHKITAADAARKLIDFCSIIGEKAYCEASVKNYFRAFENNIDLFSARYGAAAAQKQMPFTSLKPADHRNTQWQADGWVLPFWVPAPNNKIKRRVLYLIRDNHSRKIVGFSVGATENTELILAALDDAIAKTKVFPAEIVCDKHSFHKTITASRIKHETERMGATWTITMNAQRNQLAERYNQHLDAICKDIHGYLGKNIGAKGKDAHLSPEAYADLAKRKNLKSDEEILAIAAYAVKTFNEQHLPVIGMCPDEKFNASHDAKCFPMDEHQRLELLRPADIYKVQRGQITIKQGSTKHEFQLNAELISDYNNREIAVIYEDLKQGIYISDPRSGEQLGFVYPKAKLPGAIADQLEGDTVRFHKQTGRAKGVTKKARNQINDTLEAILEDNPEALHIMNSMPIYKDVRKEALENRDTRRYLELHGVNVNSLPVRNDQPTELPQVKERTKESPFMPKEQQTMQFLTVEQLLNNNK